MALASSTPEQEYKIEAIKWPRGYPYANVWIVRYYEKSDTYYPIRQIDGARDTNESKVQSALAEERAKLRAATTERDELSETCSS